MRNLKIYIVSFAIALVMRVARWFNKSWPFLLIALALLAMVYLYVTAPSVEIPQHFDWSYGGPLKQYVNNSDGFDLRNLFCLPFFFVCLHFSHDLNKGIRRLLFKIRWFFLRQQVIR